MILIFQSETEFDNFCNLLNVCVSLAKNNATDRAWILANFKHRNMLCTSSYDEYFNLCFRNGFLMIAQFENGKKIYVHPDFQDYIKE